MLTSEFLCESYLPQMGFTCTQFRVLKLTHCLHRLLTFDSQNSTSE
jgi:hypothetical protein